MQNSRTCESARTPFVSNVTIPDSVIEIGQGAFSHCAFLSNVYIGNRATSIGVGAFASCTNLTSITIPNSVTSIGSYAFQSCSGRTRVTIGTGITSIAEGAFSSCTSLTSVFIPKAVTSIGGFAFNGCSSLTSISIPNSITDITDHAFFYCPALTTAVFLGKAPIMGFSVFDSAASGFTINYLKGKTGFTSPTWNGYPCVAIDPLPEIEVQQPAGSILVDGTSKRSFGTMAVGMSGAAKTFTIWNTGTGNLSNLSIAKVGGNTGNFIVTASPKTTLAPGTPTTFTVTFKPSATGTRTTTIQIKSNDANENPFDIKLTGLGVAP